MATTPTAVILIPRCKSSFNSEPALYSTSPDSREPFTKKSKLHNLKTASVHRRATNPTLPASHPEFPQIIDSNNSLSYPTNPLSSDTKSGTLVLVSSPRKPIERSRSKSYPSTDSTQAYERQPSRCPSIVQVCRKCNEHYAVIRRTKHRLAEQSQYLNLKKCSVSVSDSRHTQFSVYLNDMEDRVFTFEASSPGVALEWVGVFSSLKSEHSGKSQSFSPIRKPFVSMNNCAVLEEEDESEDSFPATTLPAFINMSAFESQSIISTPTAAVNSNNSVDFSKTSMKFDFSKEGLSKNIVHRFPLPSNENKHSPEVFEQISKASLMPVLYEDDESEASEE